MNSNLLETAVQYQKHIAWVGIFFVGGILGYSILGYYLPTTLFLVKHVILFVGSVIGTFHLIKALRLGKTVSSDDSLWGDVPDEFYQSAKSKANNITLTSIVIYAVIHSTIFADLSFNPPGSIIADFVILISAVVWGSTFLYQLRD